MTAQLPDTAHTHGLARRRGQHDTLLVTLCWLVAAAGLAGSYWLAPLAWQAVSCLVGLLGAVAALLLTVAASR